MPEKSEIIRKSFGLKEQVRPLLEASYHSSLINRIKAEGYRLEAGRLTILLAQEFGFCYGVERAIDYAYETKARFPGRRVYLTNEIIHNPQVNAKLQQMGVEFLSGPYSNGASVEAVGPEDVVIIPAFGTTLRDLDRLQQRRCVLVDTTCGSVMSVWKRVESYSRESFTSIIHGKYDHEETQATSSRAVQYSGGKYLIIRDKAQAEIVCGYIEGKGRREDFLKEFEKAVSEGFDPDRHLERVGCANQTTMLSSESLEIANMLQASMGRRWGREELEKRFRHFDTICSATQDRQDAVLKLAREDVDLMIVVGGYNSSNTGHLVEISLELCPAFHVKDAACLVSRDLIRHKKTVGAGLKPAPTDIIETAGWLPQGPVKVGVTAGASTPNRVIEEVIERILEFA